MLFRTFLFLLISLTIVNPLLSQTENHDNPCPICKDGVHVSDSPYKKGIKTELPFLIAGTGLVGSGFLLQSINTTEAFSENEINNLDRNSVNPFDRPATYNWDPGAATTSDYLAVGVMVLPALLLSTHHTRSDLGNLIVMGLEVGMINYGIALSVKNLANRTRPYVYNPNAPLGEKTNDDGRLSFFSAHTSHTAAVSFFFAKVMNDYHPNMKTGLKITMWTVAMAVPTATAYL
ncbi:MAG: hypothetical protein DRJ05_20050, partial [Bacteroidetes bacterium]